MAGAGLGASRQRGDGFASFPGAPGTVASVAQNLVRKDETASRTQMNWKRVTRGQSAHGGRGQDGEGGGTSEGTAFPNSFTGQWDRGGRSASRHSHAQRPGGGQGGAPPPLWGPPSLARVCLPWTRPLGLTTQPPPKVAELVTKPHCHCHGTEPCVNGGLSCTGCSGLRPPLGQPLRPHSSCPGTTGVCPLCPPARPRGPQSCGQDPRLCFLFIAVIS